MSVKELCQKSTLASVVQQQQRRAVSGGLGIQSQIIRLRSLRWVASLTFNRYLELKNTPYPDTRSAVHLSPVYHCRRWSTSMTQSKLRETSVRNLFRPGPVGRKSYRTHIFLKQWFSSKSEPSRTASSCRCLLINAPIACHLSHTFVTQMGILHYSWLRVGCHPRASSLPANNMGP